MKGGKVPAVYWDEAIADARRWQQKAEQYEAQARRLFAALKRTEAELGEELFRLQTDLSWSQDANACLVLENSELSFQLQQIRGDA